MPTIELSDDERAALAAFLRDAIAADRFPMSPRWRLIKGALAKIDPQSSRPPLPPLKPPGTPSLVLRKMRGRTSEGIAVDLRTGGLGSIVRDMLAPRAMEAVA